MRPKNLTFTLALGMIFLSGPVAGGDSEAERLQKAKRDLAAVDADLNKTFQALRKKLPADEFKELRDQ